MDTKDSKSNESKIKIARPIIFQIGLFILQFLILPLVYQISSFDAQRQLIVLIITTTLLTYIGIWKFDDRFRFWYLGHLIYFVLLLIAIPLGEYGIGQGMFSFALFDSFVLAIIVLINQFIIWILIKIIKSVRSKNA